jgi:hypothetical protein
MSNIVTFPITAGNNTHGHKWNNTVFAGRCGIIDKHKRCKSMIALMSTVQFSDDYVRVNQQLQKPYRKGKVVGYAYGGEFAKVLWDGNLTPRNYHMDLLKPLEPENRMKEDQGFSFATFKSPELITRKDIDDLFDHLQRMKEYQKYIKTLSMKPTERNWQIIQTDREIQRLENYLAIKEELV